MEASGAAEIGHLKEREIDTYLVREKRPREREREKEYFSIGAEELRRGRERKRAKERERERATYLVKGELLHLLSESKWPPTSTRASSGIIVSVELLRQPPPYHFLHP